MKTKRLEVKEGNISIPIYEFSDGRYCVDTLLGGTRKRITRASLEAAKIEARKLLAQIATGRQNENLLSISEAEDYRLAKAKLSSYPVSRASGAASAEQCTTSKGFPYTRSINSTSKEREPVDEYLRYTEIQSNRIFVTVECLYGFKPALPDGIKRIVKP